MGNNCSNSSLSGLELVEVCSHSNSTLQLSDLSSCNLVWGVVGLAMAALTLAVLISLLSFRKYRTPLQRLFIYLTIFTFLGLANDSLNVALLRLRCFHEEVCRAVGFVDVCVFITSTLLLLGIGLYLLVVVYYHVQGHPLPRASSGCRAGIVELAYLLAVVVVPPVVLLRSYSSFGLGGGGYCWVERYNTSCDQRTDRMDDSMYREPVEIKILSTLTVIMTVNVTVFVLLQAISLLLACRRRHQQVRSHHRHIARRASLLLVFLMAYFVVNLATLWAHYHHHPTTEASFPLMVCEVVVLPCSQGLIPIGFLVYHYNYSRKTMTVRDQFSKWKKRLSLLLRRRSRSTELASAHLVTPTRPGCQATATCTVSREVGYTTGAFTAVPSVYGSSDQTRNSSE